VVTFLGRRVAYTYEVREVVADERMVMSTAEGPFPMETTYMWEDAAEGRTNMTLRNRGEPLGSFKLLGRLWPSRSDARTGRTSPDSRPSWKPSRETEHRSVGSR
jgi:hypothetical protein